MNETGSGSNHSMVDSLIRHQIPLISVSSVSMAVGLILAFNNLWHLRVASNTRYVKQLNSLVFTDCDGLNQACGVREHNFMLRI